MTVNIERHLDARMPKLLLDVFDILTSVDSHAGTGMSDAGRGDPSELSFLQGSVKVPLDRVFMNGWLPFRAGKDQIMLVDRTGKPPEGV